MVGFGVLSHDLGLSGHLARRIAAETGSGVDIDVVTGYEFHARHVPPLLADVDLDRYDLVIVGIGTLDVVDRTRIKDWSAHFEHILDVLQDGQKGFLPVSVVAVPTISNLLQLEPHLAHAADQRAAELNLRLKQLCDVRPLTTFVPFSIGGSTAPVLERTSASYARMADRLMQGMGPSLAMLKHDGAPCPRESARQAALDRLGLLDMPADEMLDSIVHKTHRLFGTVGAGISLIDHDRQWFCNSAGAAIAEIARSESICAHTIQTNHGLVVEDTRLDPRFANHIVVAAGLRSYAGVPIRDPNGHMIGALCVYDNNPHAFQSADLVMLQHLAHSVEERVATLSKRLPART